MRILFLGTPAFACPTLQALLESPHEILGVVTQPDRPKGRGRKLTPPPVKIIAATKNLPVFQPEKVRDPSFLRACQDLQPEIIVVVAYGQILPQILLSLPPRGCVNIHGSLLPKYRGAAPITRAVLAGDTLTGITTMLMDEGMDTGPILGTEETPIAKDDTTGSLQDRLAGIGAGLLLRTLEGLEKGTITPKPQDHSRATYAPKIAKEEGKIDWNAPALTLFNLIRAFDPWPGAFTLWEGRVLKLFHPSITEEENRKTPGTVVNASAEGLAIATGRGILLVSELQAENRSRMKAKDFLRGHSLTPGTRLGV
ncbi:MAG: methionyl-tRNA formyltransferase [Deltaproteobacteria bacterium]|nr:methionyl-tRNA formyltransferase [Deltaproteobacteria bacterium]